MRRSLFILISFLLFSQTFAQRKQGSWQDYLSFSNAVKIADAGPRVYCATEGGLFYLDKDDNSIEKFSGLSVLNDFGIKNIAYSETNDLLVVIYANSNIDLVFNSQVFNIPDIMRKHITGDKSIYNILLSGNEAYLSCGFGIVVLNLDKKEVGDTYFIGDEGSHLRVNDVKIYDSFIYAATDEGLLRAGINSNLLDFRNWEKTDNIPHSNDKFNHIIVHNGLLMANYTPDQYNQDELFLYDGFEWIPVLPRINYISDVKIADNTMVITGRGEIIFVGSDNNITGIINKYQFTDREINTINPLSATAGSDGSVWVADYGYGLVHISGEYAESVFPEGPKDNKVFCLTSNNGDLWLAPGGRNDTWNNTWQSPRIELLREGRWSSFSKVNIPELDGFFDIVNIAVDPADPDHFFAGSWGGGILEFRNNGLVNRFTEYNSPLQSALPDQAGEPYVRIGGMDFDSQGNLWITNSEVAENLLMLSPGGEWNSFTLPEIAKIKSIGPLVVTENDDKWIMVPRGSDLYVTDKSGSQKRALQVISYFNNGEKEFFNRMNDVYCITEDLEGEIWIGTSKGVAVYKNPQQVWNNENFYAIQPGLDLNDGLYHPLLETETVTAITIDGANRKWIGTKGSGVFLVSENGEKEILHFTSDNSPLMSNTITTIAVNQISGEVFFGTGDGLISYQGDAVKGNDSFAGVYVYPNPVREDWDGPVTVTGLMENSDIRITDITGNLVFKTTSLGGQAVWNGKNLNGNRVKTGVYLVFCIGKNGQKTHIEKLLFIN
ncbi:MAG: T9SS type A sorting domain-containing protein [Prolixibacteraceae bacterium]|nr:T9SS type A sorting domain-containing protein [Prolixibacteraceae bacterium]